MDYYSAIKKNKIMDFAGNLDRTTKEHTECSVPDSERQIPLDASKFKLS